MVTKLADGRGQVSIKGRQVDDAWEQLVRKAASRAGTTFAGFIVDHSTAAAQAILKGEAAVTTGLPVPIEDIAAGLSEQIALLATEQRDRLDHLAAEQRDLLDRMRQARRGRWRR